MNLFVSGRSIILGISGVVRVFGFGGGGGGRTPEHVPSENLEMRTLLTRVLRVKFCRIPKIKSGTKGMIFYDLKNLSSDHQTFFRRIKWIAKSEILS